MAVRGFVDNGAFDSTAIADEKTFPFALPVACSRRSGQSGPRRRLHVDRCGRRACGDAGPNRVRR
ncbi:hypothetical protein EMIT0158MI4_30067 [Burkholderia ambifaria]